MRQQTYIMVSPYMNKGEGYSKFKRGWQFGWENIELPIQQPLTKEEIQSIIEKHSKFKKVK